MIRTFADAIIACRRITFPHAKIPTIVRMYDGHVEVWIEVLDRDTGDPLSLSFAPHEPISFLLPCTEEGFFRYVTSLVVKAWSHEATEVMRIDGARQWFLDPHDGVNWT